MADPASSWLSSNAHAMLDVFVDAVITIDSYGYVQYVNAAACSMFGYQQGELIYQPITKIMPRQYRQEHQSYVESYLAIGKPRILGVGRETVALSSDGKTFPIHLNVNELVTEDELYFVAIVRQVSESVPSESSLVAHGQRYARINRLSTLGAMMANIAHELNQPLAAIALYARSSQQLLRRRAVDVEKLITALERLIEQSLRAGDVIEWIQNRVRVEHGEKKVADLNEVLREVKPLIVADVRASGLELDYLPMAHSLKIFCSPVQIQQVVIDLVRNAVDAMHEVDCRYGRVIKLHCTSLSPGFVTVSVVDRGTGVADSNRDVVFEAFRSTKLEGTGLGLPVSRSMIELHEGTLRFENNADWGATFSFTLPVHDHAQP